MSRLYYRRQSSSTYGNDNHVSGITGIGIVCVRHGSLNPYIGPQAAFVPKLVRNYIKYPGTKLKNQDNPRNASTSKTIFVFISNKFI